VTKSNPIPVIEAVRDGRGLEEGSLEAFLSGYLHGDVEEYQMAAFLMAVVLRGLDPGELASMVQVMLHSGAVLDFSHLPAARVDKHSTGGVGDKVSLVLAPLVAEAGVYVPMMSGRGLGHTGGTLDKLESIPGFRTDLDLAEFRDLVEEEGFAMIGQTAEIAPLDRRLYDLRSVTGTVPSIPLIAASIMSKKLAEGLTGLVLDVKAGAGAFLPQEERALELARTLVGIGTEHGVETVALVTAMDRPLGAAVGNAVEVREALACLRGEGPADLRAVVLALAGEMMDVAGTVGDRDEGGRRAAELLDSGRPLERFRRVIRRQGGDPEVVDDPDRLPTAPVLREVKAGRAGRVHAIDPLALGRGVVSLGGGRTRLGQDIDHRVGFELAVGVGDDAAEGQLLGRVHAATAESAEKGAAALLKAVRMGEEAGSAADDGPRVLISHRISRRGVELLT
jgi:pyrimidine-nucleoside phosphorylase